MHGNLQLAPESIDYIASFLEPADATSLACSKSTFRDAGQRAVFRNAVFKTGNVEERLLQFMRSLYARPDMGKYVVRFHVEPVLPIAHPGQRESMLKTIDGLWPHLPGLRRLTLLWQSSLDALTFDGCTDGLRELVVTHCTENMQALLRRNGGLVHLSVFAPLDLDATRPVPVDAIPRLQRLRADVDTLCAMVPGRAITVLCISQPVPLEQFMDVAPTLAETTGQLKKLNLYLSVGERLSVVAGWHFMKPFARHMATLESLTLKFALAWFHFIDVVDLCACIPNSLKALKTLRLWLPGPIGDWSWKDLGKRFNNETVDDDLWLVQNAHKQCPSLRHVSLLHRIDWHLVDADWIPLLTGTHRHALESWLVKHEHQQCDIDAAETDSLVSEPAGYIEYEPPSDDNDDDDEDFTDEDFVEWSEGELLAELDELVNENNNLPPAGSGLSDDAWHEILEAGVQESTIRSFAPAPDPEIAALLQEVQEASHGNMNVVQTETV